MSAGWAEALSRAKQAIFALHRGDRKEGISILNESERRLFDIGKKFAKIRGLEYEGSYRAAAEEYAEARLFERYLAEKKIGPVAAPGMDEDVYLAGLMDFTGELVRHAIARATARDTKEVARAHAEVRAVIAEVIQMNLTGSLRSKYDQVKTNLKKMEEIAYELSLRGA